MKISPKQEAYWEVKSDLYAYHRLPAFTQLPLNMYTPCTLCNTLRQQHTLFFTDWETVTPFQIIFCDIDWMYTLYAIRCSFSWKHKWWQKACSIFYYCFLQTLGYISQYLGHFKKTLLTVLLTNFQLGTAVNCPFKMQ